MIYQYPLPKLKQFLPIMAYAVIFLFLFPLYSYAIDWHALTEEIFYHPELFDLQPVDKGASNSNYLLTYEGTTYFIRCGSPNVEIVNGSMEIEYYVLDELKEYHISPWPFYFNKDKKILVLEYIQNDNKEIVLEDASIRGKVLSLLHQIEDLEIEIPRFYQPYQEILKYVELAKSSGDPLPEAFYNEMLPALKKIDERLTKIQNWKLCHFDLCHKNILKSNDRLWIIDWEYATMGDPLLNLASIASIQRWDDDQMEILLQDYNPNKEKADFYRLYLYRIMTDIHWFLWNHIQNTRSTINAPYQIWSKLFFDAALKRIKSPLCLEALTIN